MAWMYILIAVAAIFILVFVLPVRLRIKAGGEGVNATLEFLFIRYVLFPSGQKSKKGKPLKKKKKKKSAPKKEVSKKPKMSSDVISQIGAIIDIVKELLSHLRKRLHIRLYNLNIVVGSDEAAKTAMEYAAICNACDELLFALGQFLKFSQADGAVDISADFTREKTFADVDIGISINLHGALRVLLPVLMKYLKQKG